MNKKKLALTIAGGGVRSTASIGVIEFLEKNKIKIDAISGTSAGAIIAILYAYGLKTSAIKKIIEDMTFKDFLNVSYSGLMSLKNIEKMLKENLEGRERVIPIEVAVTNKETMEPEYFRNRPTDEMIQAVLASSSLKYVFKPVKINNKLYKDGGYSNNMPYINFHKEEYLTIAIKTDFKKKKKTTFRKACKKRIKYPDIKPDYLISVNNIANITTFELNRTTYIMKNGYRIARDTLPVKEIKEKLKA